MGIGSIVLGGKEIDVSIPISVVTGGYLGAYEVADGWIRRDGCRVLFYMGIFGGWKSRMEGLAMRYR